MKLRQLKKNGTIGILTSASPLEPAVAYSGITTLERNGFEVVCPLDASTGYDTDEFGFAAGSIKSRVEAFKSLFEDDSVDVIISSRGGYGTMELLPELDFSVVKNNPKVLVGFSDVTPLLIQLAYGVGVPSVHGPALKSIAESEDSLEPLIDLLITGHAPKLTGKVLRKGASEGNLIVGNLTMLTTMLGTPWDVSYDGAILVIEDIGELPFRTERTLRHLKLAGKLDNLAGLAFGQFTNCSTSAGLTTEQVIERSVLGVLKDTDYPVIIDLDVGHVSKNSPLPLGKRAKISNGNLEVTESLF